MGQPDETLPGFRSQNMLEAHGLDNISPFSGDLGIVIPLGPQYTLSSYSTWQMKAFYSAHLWRMDAGRCADDYLGSVATKHAYLRGDPTIGVGWTLSLGYVGLSDLGDVGHIGYFSPDGGFHEDGTDGSHVRITPQGSPATSYTVDFPDGSRHTFANKFDTPHALNGTSSPDFTELGWPSTPMTPAKRFGLTKIEDSFRNVVLTVNYDPTIPWEVTSISLPTLGRTISINWATLPFAGVNWAVIQSIDFPVFGTASKRHVVFGYQAATFPRNIYDNSSAYQQPCWNQNPPPSPTSVAVPALSSITFTDTPGSTFSYQYLMSYYAQPDSDSLQQQGALQQITLPTGGYLFYTYSNNSATCEVSGCSPETFTPPQLPRAPLSPQTPPGPHAPQSQEFLYALDKSIAVSARCESVAAPTQPPTCPASAATTTYVRHNFMVACNPQCYPNGDRPGYDWNPYSMVRRVDVLGPGNDTNQYLARYYFHVAASVDAPLQYHDGGLELERRTYRDATTATIARAVVSCWDPAFSGLGGGGCGYHTSTGVTSLRLLAITNQPPKQAEVTWFGAVASGSDGGTCATGSGACKAAVNSGYDSVALQYQTTAVSSANMPSGASLPRTSFTEWAPVVDSSHYLLNTFDERNETEGTNTIYRGFEFDTTGFLRGQWTSDQPYDPNNRSLLLQCRYPDMVGSPKGSPKWDFSATYDHTVGVLTPAPPPRPFALLCSTYYPSYPGATIGTNNDAFGHINTFTHGQLLTSAWVNGGGTDSPTSIGWYRFNVARDASSGLISSSSDTAGFSTSSTYDQLGRINQIVPQTQAPTTELPTYVCYDSSSATKATVYRAASAGSCPVTGATAGIQTWQQYLYDGLGRLIRELRLMPAGAYAFRTHDYDAAGHRKSDSEWQSCTSPSGDCASTTPASVTQYSNYDPFGRAQATSRADGSNTQTDYTDGPIFFSDTKKTVTVNNVNGSCQLGSCSGGSSPQTVYVSDVYGRLVQVIEPTGGGTTNYGYDVNGKLTTVSQVGASLNRTFTYDSFGFLRSETTPEKGIVDSTGTLAGGGLKIGSLGNVKERTEAYGTAHPQTHDLTYEAAGRVLTEKVNGTQYFSNSYDGAGFGGGTYKLGKLTQRIGYNPLLTGQPSVTDNFTYSGVGGRLSSQQTLISGSQPLTTTQGWVYNSLGLVGQHSHARVAGASPLIVTTDTDAGLPSREYVNGIPAVTAVTYAASGALSSYTTGFGIGKNMVTTIQQDVLSRPADISTTRQDLFTASFDTGAYTYDGVGNIKAMGPDAFGYDNLSRLTSASLSGAGTQNYTYDPYGNLLTKGGTTFCTGTCPNNRVAGLSALYDERGNLTSFSSEGYGYDGLNRTISSSTGYTYVLDGADERVARLVSNSATFTLRDESKRLSTEYGGTSASRDNIYLGTILVASYANAGITGNGQIWTFLASDHLGTPRLVTDLLGIALETRKNWPFGEQVSQSASLERVRFAAMEQDTEAGINNDRFYDHARHHGAVLGRFLAVDTVGGRAGDPQSWNRYSYGRNNPLKLLDPTGLEVKYANDHLKGLTEYLRARSPKIRATLERYSGAGAPDLFIQRGEVLPDRFTGEKLRGDFDPKIQPSYKKGEGYTVSDPKAMDQYPETGKNLTGATLTSATITLDTGLTPGSSQESNILVHELGHAEDAAKDPLTFAKTTAIDANYDASGHAVLHNDRVEEQNANRYRDEACGGKTVSCPQFPPH